MSQNFRPFDGPQFEGLKRDLEEKTKRKIPIAVFVRYPPVWIYSGLVIFDLTGGDLAFTFSLLTIIVALFGVEVAYRSRAEARQRCREFHLPLKLVELIEAWNAHFTKVSDGHGGIIGGLGAWSYEDLASVDQDLAREARVICRGLNRWLDELTYEVDDGDHRYAMPDEPNDVEAKVYMLGERMTRFESRYRELTLRQETDVRSQLVDASTPKASDSYSDPDEADCRDAHRRARAAEKGTTQ